MATAYQDTTLWRAAFCGPDLSQTESAASYGGNWVTGVRKAA
jgi:hypothetical protein